ncbi:kelch repeat and BTB domain-containing protein 12-like isoform X1 [Cololabis saira]|uniref:kelch repeat and BTB domain-containing protein 12-like isoform X1 n=2 Tax=Cololabis saira TaxID=129043 RepID=UPI002AD1D322|nr:kelch repeat and BTB domain-containing protein 12-like isoform X1 [Cololabis saira]XP_061591992.1 kelch repeat and BTB domain-containing protein 12-like isoform X1 [Cololabis saira]XP_061591993.1 kelch repeat and BTB domain-containing protein 12-like isoform X1 [Cololabis saira]
MEAEVDLSAQGQHASFLLKQLDRMRAVTELTDVVLLAEGVPFPCHKVVLSAFSPYFQAMFTCGLKETWGGEVPLRDTPAQSLELLLNYMYRAELPLSNSNIQAVAATAFLLNVDGAFRLCQRHMEAALDPSNCIGLYHWARDLGATDLADCAMRYLCQHFTKVCEEEEVLELDAQSLGDLLGSDDLNISREEVVLELVLRWLERRRGDSQSEAQALELLKHVRLELVDPGFLRKTRRRNPVLLRDAECFGRIDAALQTSGLSEASAPPRPPLRYGMETTDLLLCLGGVDEEGVPVRRGGLADLSFCFAPRVRKAFYIPSPLRGCRGMGQVTAGAVTRDNNVVVAIEAEDQHRMKRVDIYRYCSSEKNNWVEVCSAPYRDMYALGLVGDSLYLIGGQMKVHNHYVVTKSVERWSLKRGDSWLSFAPLPLPLACHSVVSLKEHLYVLGGWTPQDQPDDEPDKLSNRVFRFDPSKDRWTECEKMKYSRYRCGTSVLNGEIYITGGIGCDGDDRGQSRRCLSSVEIYNPDTDTWRSGPTLPTSLLSLRTNTSNTGVVDGKVYICGYYKGASRHEIITKEILELDPEDNVWTVVEKRAAMHDSYDVCLVANLNPRDLFRP